MANKKTKKNSKPEPLTPQQTLERFVIRARRIKAHSLVQTGQAKEYAKPSGTITMPTTTGQTSIQEHVITDEEALESLASRLRPFLVKSEPIHLPKVFDAIRSCVSEESLTEDMQKCLDSAESWFKHRYEEKDSKTFAIQMLDKDGNPQTGYLSDALLADSWIYADVVHADPQGDKAEGLKAGYLSRYEAASSFFCEFALVIVSLLNILKGLSDKGALQLSDQVWNEPVTYEEAEKNKAEKVVEGSLYVFPVGTEIPSGVDPKDIPGAVKATPMTMSRLAKPEGKAALITFDAEGNQTSCLRAFRDISDASFVFTIDDAVILRVPTQPPSDEQGAAIPFSLTPVGEDEEHYKRYLSIGNSMVDPNSGKLFFNYHGKGCMLDISLTRQIDDEEPA